LFKPRVPDVTDACEIGDFFPPEPRRPASLAFYQSYIAWTDLGAFAPQKFGELNAAFIVATSHRISLPFLVAIGLSVFKRSQNTH
jgi:hypothetical protein